VDSPTVVRGDDTLVKMRVGLVLTLQ